MRSRAVSFSRGVLRGDLLPPAAAGRRVVARAGRVGGARSTGLLLSPSAAQHRSRPFQTGSRFSKKALTPSIRSSVGTRASSWARRNRARRRTPCPAGGTSRPCRACIISRRLRRRGRRTSRRPRLNSSAGGDLVDDPDPVRLVRTRSARRAAAARWPSCADVAVDQRHDHEREHADVDLGRAEAARPPAR